MPGARTCTQCGAESVEVPAGQAARFQRILFGATVLSGGGVSVTRVVCLSCGYVDAWVERGDLARLADKLGVASQKGRSDGG